jgi:hypothetical protein
VAWACHHAGAVRTVRWATPGPALVAAWLAVTFAMPLLYFNATNLWESDQGATSAAKWAVATTPLVTVVTAAAAARRPGSRPVPVMLGALASGGVLLAAALVCWLWIIPLDDSLDVAAVAVPAAALSAVGAVVGYAVGTKLPPPSDRPAGVRGYVLGAVVVLIGALLALEVIRIGAEDSTISYSDGYHSKGDAVVLPAAGRYAILGLADGPRRPDCRITGGGVTGRRADVVTVAPADYSGNATSIAWVATFTAPGPGTYELKCRGDGFYSVGDVPRIRGAVGSLIHWPLVVLLLLGALPGLAIVGRTARRRRAGQGQ